MIGIKLFVAWRLIDTFDPHLRHGKRRIKPDIGSLSPRKQRDTLRTCERRCRVSTEIHLDGVSVSDTAFT